MVIEDVVEELGSFVYWLAHKRASGDSTIMMDADELAGELFLELVKGFQYYEERNLTMPQMKAVLKQIMNNRIGELVHRYFSTHRKDGLNYIPVDSLEEFDDADGAYALRISAKLVVSVSVQNAAELPEQALEAKDRVAETLSLLSPDALEVAEAAIYGNDLLGMQLQLAGERAAFVYAGRGTIQPKPRHVADALGLPIRQVRVAFTEIADAYAEVCNG